MIFDETAWRAFQAPHDHVLAEQQDAPGFWACQVGACTFAMADESFPVGEPPRVAWQDPIVPNRRGKRAAYEEAVRTMEETIGPSQPLIGRDGRERGRFWDESFTARGGQ